MKTKKEKLNDKDSLEIQQIICDDDRENDKSILLEDERKKHEVVEKALAMLAEAEIYAYIYADIPNPHTLPGIPCVYQFNTLQALIKYDDSGNRTEESSSKNAFFHSGLWKSLVDTVILFTPGSIKSGYDKLDPKDPTTHRKRMEYMDFYITMCYQDYQKRMFEIIDNPV